MSYGVNGQKWSKYEKNPILDVSQNSWDSTYIAANGSAIVFNGKTLYFYQGRSYKYSFSDRDGTIRGFSKFYYNEFAVLTVGEKHSWDSNGVADPYVIEHNGILYMYYLGMEEMQVQRLGGAYSTDGINWVKGAYPIMDDGSKGSFDENGLGEPSVVYNVPYFYMLYTGRESDEKRDIGTAISLDGVFGTKQFSGVTLREQSGYLPGYKSFSGYSASRKFDDHKLDHAVEQIFNHLINLGLVE